MKWRVNFTVPNCNFNLIGYAPGAFLRNVPQKDNEPLLKEWYLEYSEGTVVAYVPVKDIEETVGWIRDKIISDINWADELHKKAEDLNHIYFAYAKKVLDYDLKIISDNELFELYKTLKDYQLSSHFWSISTTWFLDSDGEVYSKYLKNELQKYLESIGVKDKKKIIEYFILLTTPFKENFVYEEQLDFLYLLKKIKSDQQSKKILRRTSPNAQEIFNSLKSDIKDEINEYYKKWHWTPYGYIGPAYTLDYYIDEIRKQIMVINPDKLIKEEKERFSKIKKEQDKLMAEIKLPEKLEHLFAVAQDIIWLKDFRKYCIWHGHYVLDKLTFEIARRFKISHKQANHLLVDEVKQIINNGEIDHNLINSRIDYCVMWSDGKTEKYYYGNEARKIITDLDVEEIAINYEAGFQGTCACTGEVIGRVKIVNSLADIGKVADGDIMLAHTTYPAMLPAMKKAGAIITEDGGITCHAAIVSREFKIPCVVGVKHITRELRDGDRVHVDAISGVITLLN